MGRQGWLAAMALLGMTAGVGVPCAGAQASGQSGLAFTRAQHLRRGINLSMWYAQANDYSAARLASYTTEDDFKLVHDAGFDHVRLSINPEPLIEDAKMGTLRADAMARLDATAKQITALGLVVILDIHPEEAWKKSVTTTDEGTANFFVFWKSFAQHFAGSDPEQVYFELLNEPEGVNAYRWAGEQARLVAILREQAPHHTIIATGEGWGSIDGLVAIEPVRDDNVIYSFHDYEPMEFTHQGATWAGDNLKLLRGVPYPSTPENVTPLLAALPEGSGARKDLAWYGQQSWEIATMQRRIGLAVAWGRQRHVPVWCGEFGVYRTYSAPADRARWITDMRSALEQNGVGWDMWDYQGGFALVTKKDGVTTVDPDVLKALGLRMKKER